MKTMEMKAVILAAGLGTRLEPLTLTMSKGMIPVANKPLLHWIASRFEEYVIVARNNQKDILDYFKNSEIIIQKEPKGTANALLQCKDIIQGDFIVTNTDDLFSKDDIDRVSRHNGFAVAVSRHDKPENFGTITMDGGRISSIEEKQSGSSGHVNCGLYKMGKEFFKYLEKTTLSNRNEYEITESINLAIAGGMNFDAVEVNGWQTVSHPWDILEANKKILDETKSVISSSAEIRPGSYIEEPVAIGDGAVIGPNCYIRKYSSIGAGCKIGNAVEIKNSIIMENSFVSHLSYVGDSVIGRDCNIGAGTIFANLRLDDNEINMNVKGEKISSGKRKLGGIVADGAKFGVNVTVMPGKKIWPGMLVPPCITIKDDMKEQPSLRS